MPLSPYSIIIELPRASGHGDLPSRLELSNDVSFNMSSTTSTMGETLASIMQAEWDMDADFQFELLSEYIDHLAEEDRATDGPTNLVPGFSVPLGTFQQPSFAVESAPPAVPASLTHPSYACSWCNQGQDVQCEHSSPTRLALLRHLGAEHQASGGPKKKITCRLLDVKTGSVCGKSVSRGSLPRHVDTHYPVRHPCPHCPIGTTFSRQDSLNQHIKDIHLNAPLES